jgi:hypothetical protein
MPTPRRDATDEERLEVLEQLPEPVESRSVTISALCREDGAAWFWVMPRAVPLGEVYLTWVLERSPRGEWSVGSFRSRRTGRGDVTVP